MSVCQLAIGNIFRELTPNFSHNIQVLNNFPITPTNMNWHTGDIAEAVAESKLKNAIFVVYIEGQDEMSAKLNRFLGDDRVSSRLLTDDFVSVKIQADSETYRQFTSLYKVVPVPSIFFIAKSGTPLDVTTGIIDSVEELVVKIDKVLFLAGKQPSPVASSIATPVEETVHSNAGADESERKVNQDTDPEPVAEPPKPEPESAKPEEETPKPSEEPSSDSPGSSDSFNTETPKTAAEPTAAFLTAAAAAEKRAASAAAVAASAASSLLASSLMVPVSVPLVPATVVAAAPTQGSLESRLVDAQQLIEQRRAQREEEQKRQEKEKELRRRREGRDAQVHQAQTREQELKNMQERIRRERQEEQQARERILAQIAADRAELANRAAKKEATDTAAPAAEAASKSSSASIRTAIDETRLQIRLPDGVTRTKAFGVEVPLSTVRVYVVNELLVDSGIRDFSLATSYPRREFKSEDELKSLDELNLVPNAVLLVIKREETSSAVRTSNSLFSILSSVLWAFLTPATMALDFINRMGIQRLRQMIFRPRPEEGAAGNNPVSVQEDAMARRNMDIFLASRTTPPSADGSDDATSAFNASDQQPTDSNISQSQSSIRFRGSRYGASNIHRLTDNKDDTEDKATYNGNSTQQQ